MNGIVSKIMDHKVAILVILALIFILPKLVK